jgi:hypothetical protein
MSKSLPAIRAIYHVKSSFSNAYRISKLVTVIRGTLWSALQTLDSDGNFAL